MTQILEAPQLDHVRAHRDSRRLPFGLLKELERPEHLFRDLGPDAPTTQPAS
jgi:hypothetical protein